MFAVHFTFNWLLLIFAIQDNIKMSLDGFRCAGAVQYSTDGEKPSGYICADNWGKN